MQITDELKDWGEIKERYRKHIHLGILLGNGASRAIWDRFGYASLYDFACDPARSNPLTPVDQQVFEEMQTTNFETVLSALATSRMVCRYLKMDHDKIEDRYKSIRLSLLSTIREIHVEYSKVVKSTKDWLAKALRHYRYVYTLNYDLLLYWAMMANPEGFKDFMWGSENTFDENDAHEWNDEATKVLYLHGGLHLYHDPYGRTYKIVANDDNGNILSQFNVSDDRIPLFVSEGTYKDKLRAIRGNSYLNFTYWKFQYHRGPLVVFGSSLTADFDQHIIDAMQGWSQYDKNRLDMTRVNKRLIAISVYPGTEPENIIEIKNRLVSNLKYHDVEFFDSTTHPLGSDKLQIV